jgi:hypothetical protein
MSNTEAVNEQPEKPVPVDQIEPFTLSDGAFGRVLKGHPDARLPKEAIPHILKETHFVDDPKQEQEKWSRELAVAVGTGQQECRYCANSQRVEHNRIGPVTGIRIVQEIDCQCKMHRKFYRHWYNPANVSTIFRPLHMGNLEGYYRNFKTFQYDPENPNAPSAFKDLLDTVRKYDDNCYLLTGKAGTGKTTLLTAMYHRALMEWCLQSFYDKRFGASSACGRSMRTCWRSSSVTGRCVTKAVTPRPVSPRSCRR